MVAYEALSPSTDPTEKTGVFDVDIVIMQNESSSLKNAVKDVNDKWKNGTVPYLISSKFSMQLNHYFVKLNSQDKLNCECNGIYFFEKLNTTEASWHEHFWSFSDKLVYHLPHEEPRRTIS